MEEGNKKEEGTNYSIKNYVLVNCICVLRLLLFYVTTIHLQYVKIDKTANGDTAKRIFTLNAINK